MSPLNISLSIIIPALNEAENIAPMVHESIQTLRQLTTARRELIVVDDASTDSMPAILADLQQQYADELIVLRNPETLGCHPSSLRGFLQATGQYRLFLPADRQILPETFKLFLQPALQQDDSKRNDTKQFAEIVYSWRQHRADPLHRRLISGLYNQLLRLLFGLQFHDVDSAAMLSARAVEAIVPTLGSNSAFITVEILIRAQQLGLQTAEVVIPHYPRTAGKAKGVNLKDALCVPANLLGLLLWFVLQKIQANNTSDKQHKRTEPR